MHNMQNCKINRNSETFIINIAKIVQIYFIQIAKI